MWSMWRSNWSSHHQLISKELFLMRSQRGFPLANSDTSHWKMLWRRLSKRKRQWCNMSARYLHSKRFQIYLLSLNGVNKDSWARWLPINWKNKMSSLTPLSKSKQWELSQIKVHRRSTHHQMITYACCTIIKRSLRPLCHPTKQMAATRLQWIHQRQSQLTDRYDKYSYYK